MERELEEAELLTGMVHGALEALWKLVECSGSDVGACGKELTCLLMCVAHVAEQAHNAVDGVRYDTTIREAQRAA